LPYAGSFYLPAEISLRPIGNTPIMVTDAAGEMAIRAPVAPMAAGATERVAVKVFNRSEQVWAGDRYRRLSLSYHWFNGSGQVIVKNGVRTPLPVKSIYPGQSIDADIHVRTPQEPGRYSLLLTLVQESNAWFENIGFKPARAEVDVPDPSN